MFYINSLSRLKDESFLDWKYRIIENKLTGVIDADWQDIVEVLSLNVHRDTLRKGSFMFLEMKEHFQEKMNKGMSDNQLSSLTLQKLELQKERNKLSAEKHELNKWLREQARSEIIYEKIEDAIKNLPPIEIPTFEMKLSNTEKTAVIDVADAHFGRKVSIEGFNDEIVAAYSVDIFKQRMRELLNHVIKIVQKEEITHVTVLNLGDSIDGLLRTSQLQTLQFGVIEQTMYFAEFMAEWLNALSAFVTIDYRSVMGNHSETRPLNSQRGDFANENMERIIAWHIKSRLSDNNRVHVFDAKHLVYFDVLGTKILAAHGQDEKDLEQSIKHYSMAYQEPIHILKTGHLHHLNNKTIGMSGANNIEYIQSPSICGIDDYSMKLKKTSNAGSLVTIFEKGYGKLCTYDIRLK